MLAIVLLGSCSVVYAQSSSSYKITVVPASPVSLDSIVAKVSTESTCGITPETLRIRQTGASIRVDVMITQGCIPTTGPETFDVSLGKFPPGLYSVEVFLAETVKVATTQFTVVDSNISKSAPHPLVDYTDHWWNPQESGWGMSIMQHTSDRIFAVWYVYDQNMKPVWYTLQPGAWVYFNQYAGPVYKTTGPYFGGAFNPAQVGIAQVGTASLTFDNYASGTFAYTIEGVAGTKAISRMAF